MFRIKIPVLDVFGSKDWEITQVGAPNGLRAPVPGEGVVVIFAQSSTRMISTCSCMICVARRFSRADWTTANPCEIAT